MAERRISDFVLFEETASSSWGHTFRAGHVSGTLIDHHALLYLFDGQEIDREALWRTLTSRAALAAELSDPHLSRVIEVGRAEGIPFAAYRQVPGTTFGRFIAAARSQRFPIATDQALFIVERVALALRAVFDSDSADEPLLHGSLTPDFVHLSSEGEVRVLGIEFSPSLRPFLAAEQTARRYLAPEAGAGVAPAATDDVFSLGMLLAELLMDPSSAPGDEPSHPGSGASTRDDGSEPITESLRTLLQRSLAPAEERIQNVADWQRELSRIILEGECNPTTFNLSFLLHTLLQEEIASDTTRMAAESAIRPPLAIENAVEEILPAPAAAPLPSSSRSPFLRGFLASFLGTLVLVAGFFLLRPSKAAAPDPKGSEGSLTAPSPVEPATSGFEEARFEWAADPSPPAEEEPAAASEPDSQDEAGTVLPSQRQVPIEQLVSNHVRSLEVDLRQEYESQLQELRDRLAAAQETAASSQQKPPASDPQGPAAPVAAEPAVTRRGVSPPPRPVPAQRQPTTDPRDAEPADARTRPTESPQERREPVVEAQAAAIPGADSANSALPQPMPAQPEPPAGPRDGAADSRQEAGDEPADEALPRGLSTSVASSPTAAGSQPAYQPPRLVESPKPVYPSAARRLRKSATVRVRVVVAADGTVKDASLTEDSERGLGLDRAALATAKRSIWTPASRHGEAVEAEAFLTVEFKP